jgi:hypothetical protein
VLDAQIFGRRRLELLNLGAEDKLTGAKYTLNGLIQIVPEVLHLRIEVK